MPTARKKRMPQKPGHPTKPSLPEPLPLTVKVTSLGERSDNLMFKQLKIVSLTSALLEIRDALKAKFPNDPRASIEIAPFNDGFTLEATDLEDDEAPADATARQIANVLYVERSQIRRSISNRIVHRASNRHHGE